MLRAIGIPSFGVTGFIVNVRENTIGYHEWVKVLTKQGWIPFDPTWGYFGGVGVTHVEVAHEVYDYNNWFTGYEYEGTAENVEFHNDVQLLPSRVK